MKHATELQMMLDGMRPMSVFYRTTTDTFDEKDGQRFDYFVKTGQMHRDTFFIKNISQDFRIFYTVFTMSGEEWRASVYKSLKKIGQNTWNSDLQRIEEMLFSYTSSCGAQDVTL